MNKLYVGNLSYNITENELRDLFSPHGEVSEVSIVMDRMTNKPRGFAFVTLGSSEEATAAIQALNGKSCDGRNLTVSEARPREERSSSFGRSGGGNRSRY